MPNALPTNAGPATLQDIADAIADDATRLPASATAHQCPACEGHGSDGDYRTCEACKGAGALVGDAVCVLKSGRVYVCADVAKEDTVWLLTSAVEWADDASFLAVLESVVSYGEDEVAEANSQKEAA